MNFHNYPQAIASMRRKLLQQDQHIRVLQSILDRLTLAIDKAIAFDPDLKNDAQRKAQRLERMNDPDYCLSVDQLQSAQDKKAELLIQLRLLEDQFSILKLTKREEIAQQESHYAA